MGGENISTNKQAKSPTNTTAVSLYNKKLTVTTEVTKMSSIAGRVTHFGQKMTDEECEVVYLNKFGHTEREYKKHLKKELQLFQTKWFDYRPLHPVVATYLYAHELNKTYQRQYKATRDLEVGGYIRISKGKNIWEAKNSGGFVKGRQQADLMGIPYDMYTSFAYEFLYIKKWKHMPMQNHMYAPDVIEYVQNSWANYSRSALVVCRNYDGVFTDVTMRELPEVVAHQKWLLDRVELSKVKKAATESLIERGFLF